MSRYCRNQDEQRGYDAYRERHHGKSRYDGNWDYEDGWIMAEREARNLEQDREDRRREDEAIERLSAERRANAQRIYEERLSGEGEDNMAEE